MIRAVRISTARTRATWAAQNRFARSVTAVGAARVARARQREGTLDFLDMLDAERTSADAAASLAEADARIADAQVDLFRALGGGWRGAAPATPLQAAR